MSCLHLVASPVEDRCGLLRLLGVLLGVTGSGHRLLVRSACLGLFAPDGVELGLAALVRLGLAHGRFGGDATLVGGALGVEPGLTLGGGGLDREALLLELDLALASLDLRQLGLLLGPLGQTL